MSRRRMSVSEAEGWWMDLVGRPPTGPDAVLLYRFTRKYSAARVEEAIGVVGQAKLPPSKRMALLCAWFGEYR